ncbi:MAG TPA: prolyl aminopeptidase [Caulobacteraceae bacterium]|nr:prolyl aminopeptidase [Caulobacteraceae bacterium]
MDRRDTAFFPPIRPYAQGHLRVDDIHRIYWEEAGAADGVPLVVLHGGPGGGIRPYHTRIFDPRRVRAIVYDQRGCGRSTPFAELARNTTQLLIEDLEALRRDRGIERWIVVGSSWGSALGLAYVEAHPQSCLGAIFFGVIMERRADLWWWWEGVRFVFPEVWEAFRDHLPPEERDDLRSNYVRRVLDPDPAVHGPAALAWLRYEAQTLDVWPDDAFIAGYEANEAVIGAARVFAHYDRHDFFLTESELLEGARRLGAVPGILINGRFDMCTPPRAAWELHQAWPGSEFIVAPAAGHRWTDEILAHEVVRALDRLVRNAEAARR